MYSTAVGLALYSVRHAAEFEEHHDDAMLVHAEANGVGVQSNGNTGFIKKLVNWFENL